MNEQTDPAHGGNDKDRPVGVPPHQPPLTPRREDDELDERSEESFPSSDPPSTGSPGV